MVFLRDCCSFLLPPFKLVLLPLDSARFGSGLFVSGGGVSVGMDLGYGSNNNKQWWL